MAEPWLRGPIAGMPAMVMPAAHALMQAAEDIPMAAQGLTTPQLGARPGGAAAVGFHLRHLAGSIDRLLTYARGEMLTDAQLTEMDAEIEDDGRSADDLVRVALAAIERALDVMRETPPGIYLEARGVGRRRLPTTVLGLLVHIAEHTQRHVGGIIATAKVVRVMQEGRSA
ncbi:MAG: DinB-like domain protein [Gemmatimonadetes bacterium]|nr:DinB-like domain protein [Gemmatimonadota bacterium]